jgi:serine phosphatase RsbU (regulator of sigma subunit)
VVTGSAGRLGPESLAAAHDGAPEGFCQFEADWTIAYVNPAGARLLEHAPEQLVGHSIWVALPELGGTIFHSFLLHARTVGGQVTWQGYYAPTGRWLTATAIVDGEHLQLWFRDASEGVVERPPGGGAVDRLDRDEAVDRDRLRFLAEVSETMISTLDTGESTRMLAELMVPRLCDWAFVSVFGDEGQRDQMVWVHRDVARHPDVVTYLEERVTGTGDDSAMAEAFYTGEPVKLATIPPELIEPSLPTEAGRAAWQRLDVTSLTIIPLRARGETFGGIALMNTGSRPPHSEMELAVATEAARRGALALDNARLFGRQLKVAETLQHSLLTPPPQPDDLEIAVRYRPAATNMHVGGDWYDAFQEPDGATLLVIGDVVGHNVDAAAAMGQIRSILRGIAYDRPDSPARILARVDRVMTGLHVPSMATALVARIEQIPEQERLGLRTLRWSSAGHLPPMRLRADGGVDVFDRPAETLLGAENAEQRTDHEAPLDPGDTVVFYTDGLVEHGRRGIDEGIVRLTGALTGLRAETAGELCDELLERVITGGRTDDDIAILAVRCHPST